MNENNNKDMKDMKDWIDFAKKQKKWMVDKTERGDIPPTVIVERDGVVLSIVMAPEVDKNLGLEAASICQAGFDPDAITMIMDAHIRTSSLKEGQSAEEAMEEYHKKFPNGMQHACDNEGACELGEISDCLICHRITRDGNISLVTLPYSYHGKNGGQPFKWLDEDERYKDFGSLEGENVTGYIPDSLRQIMKTKPFVHEVAQLKEMADSLNFSPERVRFHAARALLTILNSKKFLVIDLISGTHPEWTDASRIGNEIISRMCDDGILFKDAKEPIKEIIDNHIGKPEFYNKLTSLLEANRYWLPKEVNDISNFVMEFEAVCMLPPNSKASKFSEDYEYFDNSEDKDFEPKKVKVWNGDQSEFLGEGNYVGDVNVYVISMPNGSIQSIKNAEIKPSPEDIPEGGIIRSLKNPKIVLDDGQVVYGCQVWWEEVE
jgi:hypothetical protein